MNRDSSKPKRDQTHATDAYVLCTTPRTGSTLLCSLLAATRTAGKPESYFRSQDLERRAAQWQIRRADGSFEFRDYLRRAIQAGRTANGIFGVRIMWSTMQELITNLRTLDHRGNDREILASAFGRTKFVFLQRRDAVAQAVSRYRAEQTDVWHIDAEELRQADKAAVQYDRAAIQRYVRESIDHNAAWTRWFEQNEIEPLQVSYEDLDLNKASETVRVLQFLGIEPPDGPIDAPNVRMADLLSKEWIERFKTETGRLQ